MIICRVGLPEGLLVGTVSYRGFRFPTEIISHCVWLYHRFDVSLRDIEELMLERGIGVTHETIHQWTRRSGPAYASALRHRRPKPGDKWHLGGVFVKLQGRQRYLWRAVDADGNDRDVDAQGLDGHAGRRIGCCDRGRRGGGPRHIHRRRGTNGRRGRRGRSRGGRLDRRRRRGRRRGAARQQKGGQDDRKEAFHRIPRVGCRPRIT